MIVNNRNVQATGIAPTDDGFTIISPVASGNGTLMCLRLDKDMDGPSVVGNPDLGFNGLENFGQTLLPHVYFKVFTTIIISAKSNS